MKLWFSAHVEVHSKLDDGDVLHHASQCTRLLTEGTASLQYASQSTTLPLWHSLARARTTTQAAKDLHGVDMRVSNVKAVTCLAIAC